MRSDRGAGRPAEETPQHVLDGLHEQLDSWRAELKGGARRVGWKIGLNIPEVQERLGLREAVIGHLTSATQLEPGGEYAGGDAVELKVEPEVAIEVGPDEAIAGLGAAIELVDVGRPPGDVQAILAANIFHRAFVLGPSQPPPAEGIEATVTVNGKLRAQAPAPDDFTDVVQLVARQLDAVGEQLHPGDRIIGGSLTPQVDVASGDQVVVELSGLGRLEVRVS
jgi:2-keto-4-pentenoate hydratase